MRKDLAEILVCPVSKGRLVLTVEVEEGGEVIAGTLHSPESGLVYRIDGGIANLLPPDLAGE